MRRGLVELVAACTCGALAWGVFGWPDPSGALALLRTAHPTHAEVIAGVGMLAWCVVAAFTAVAGIRVARRAGPWSRAVLVLVVGCAVLGAGLVVHDHRAYQTCCGSTQAAEDALRSAP